MPRTSFRILLVLVVGIALAPIKTGSAQALALVELLVSQLGVTSTQAAGGAGAIFSLAKDRLAPDQFAQVAAAVPGMDTLLAAAPSLSSSDDDAAASKPAEGDVTKAPAQDKEAVAAAPRDATAPESAKGVGSLSDLASKVPSDALGMAQNMGGTVGTMATLADAFSQLGLPPEMVQEFIPVVLDFVNTEGGSTAMSLLQGVLL